MRLSVAIAAALAAGHPTAANAADEIFELWVNPSVEADVGRGTAELETAHRVRDGRDNTHYMRLWYGQPVAKGLTLAGGIEQRWTGRLQERRALQQLSYRTGIFRSRTRIEQRIVEGDGGIGVRLRQRIGVSIPMQQSKRLAFVANAEGFFTLRSTTQAGSTGVTGLRTLIGFERAVSKRIEIGLGYLRTQEIRRGGPDRIGHAPLLSVGFAL